MTQEAGLTGSNTTAHFKKPRQWLSGIRSGDRAALFALPLLNALTVVLAAYSLAAILNAVLFPGQLYIQFLVMLSAAGILKIVITSLETKAAHRAAGRVILDMKELLLLRWIHLPPSERDNIGSERFRSILEQGSARLYPYFSEFLPLILRSALVPLLLFAAAFNADWISGLILILTAPLIPVFIILINSGVEKITSGQWKSLQKLGGAFADSLQGMLLIKLYDLDIQKGHELHKSSSDFAVRTLNILKIAFLSAFVLEFIATISTAVIAVELGIRLLYGKVLFRDAMFLLILAPEFYLPLRQIGGKFHGSKEAAAAMEDIAGFLKQSGMPIEQLQSEAAKVQGKVSLKFENIRFRFGEKTIRMKGDHEFGPGSAVQIRGESGSGKTTFLQAIAGYLPPASGKITVNGRDLGDISSQEWRARIHLLPQFPTLFHGSLRFNILFSDERNRDAEILKVLDRLGLSARFSQLYGGLDGIISGRMPELSGGERQRLALARVLLDPRPVILLDEFTSQVDIKSGEMIMSVLGELKENRIIFIAGHRQDAAMICDHVLEMESAGVGDEG